MTDPTYSVRPSQQDDLARLADVERSAAVVYFAALGEPTDVPDVMAPDTLRACHDTGLLWISVDGSDRPVGFLAAEKIDGSLFIKEMSVHQNHQRRGLGHCLMQTALAHARDSGCASVSLTTDRLIPFNAPFYERIGFSALPIDEAPAALRLVHDQEIKSGFDPRRRILMIRRL
ncbi:GNAT family N-acetyltransferase [Microvirga puerhi]|uniref:GNAT family N-acetyltransferase n=1 Tax=Microvirga puerhi TaxID=2876078 RepID=A0ABS7VMH1_9HYPH|nr:GNAT family N-acetyltransferase [Microvirga puerhi]MBZ6076716.1 GNAT family N-acetyltransferase [Microvirga puerhi]